MDECIVCEPGRLHILWYYAEQWWVMLRNLRSWLGPECYGPLGMSIWCCQYLPGMKIQIFKSLVFLNVQ